MSNIQGKYPERKFKKGDMVLAKHIQGNLGNDGYSHIAKEHIGFVTDVFHLRRGSKGNTGPYFPYELSGHVAGWAEEELTLITPEIVKRGLKTHAVSDLPKPRKTRSLK